MNFLPAIEAPSLKQFPLLRHGFFTRQGGVSQGIYRSLNIGLGSSDDPAHVAQNRMLVAEHFGVDVSCLLTVHQYHSADVIPVTAPFSADRPKADALVSQVPGLALGIATADCAPVLFADPLNKVIGAAHAGWRGAYQGILENTVAAMEALGAQRKNILAVIGPCIGNENYEVGKEFFDRFLGLSMDNRRYFVASPQKKYYFFDLGAYNADRLKYIGVKCERLEYCTYADEVRFFSHRRMVHRKEADYGRQISVIAISGSSRDCDEET